MHHIDRAPNQRFRIEQYVPYLRENGVELTFSPLLSKEDDAVAKKMMRYSTVRAIFSKKYRSFFAPYANGAGICSVRRNLMRY